MNSLAIHRDQSQTSGQGGAPCRSMGSTRSSTANHHQFTPEHLSSLPAGGRSLSGRCAAMRRQTRARGGLSLGFERAIDHTRRISLGRSYESATEFMNFIALERAGLGAGIAAQVAAQFVTPQGEIPAADPMHQDACKLTDASEVVHVHTPRSVAFDALEASDGAQGSVPVHLGKLPFKRGELPHVGNR